MNNKLLIQRLLKTSKDGFTLIELLVVIIIIGILSAIALPAFLNQAQKAKATEAKTYVGSMNRAQQAYYTEKSSFAPSLGLLGLGIPLQTVNYDYSILNATNTNVANLGTPRVNNLQGYTGCVATVVVNNEASTRAIRLNSVINPAGISTLRDCNEFNASPNTVTGDEN